jgi:ribonuclease VapC
MSEVDQLIDGLGFQVVSVTPASAQRIAKAYETWGKDIHPAALNFGDCFAYEVAKEHGCRLLHVREDFAQTDIEGAHLKHTAQYGDEIWRGWR